jgi:hypothetical protein
MDLALKSDGTVVRWGVIDPSHQLDVPPGLSNVVAIAVSPYYIETLKSDGTVVEWGEFDGKPLPAGLGGVIAIAANYRHTVALKSDGKRNFDPFISICVSRLRVNMTVVPGQKYQLLVSKDLHTWAVAIPTFVADSKSLSQEFVVAEVGQFFRLVEVR